MSFYVHVLAFLQCDDDQDDEIQRR